VTWLLLLGISPSCFGQVIRLGVINGKNGNPLAKQHVSIALEYREGEPKPAKCDRHLSLETDANGIIKVSLPEPAPAHFPAGARLTSEYWHCVCNTPPSVITKVILEEGIVVGGDLRSPQAFVKAAPGEILFVARPFAFFERIFYPRYKE
jgi:hypothetical protein